MRIISGKNRGRVINPPKNLRARPTTDFAKENLFNVIASYFDIPTLDVLDLFSGSGSISYEFASREAVSVVSVEVNTVHHEFIKSTIKNFAMANIFAIKANSFLYLKSCRKQFDIIFADPPYDMDGIPTLPDMVFNGNLLKKDGWFILEHSKDQNFTEHPNFSQQRSYGSVNFSIFCEE